jgi:hypothetical protein
MDLQCAGGPGFSIDVDKTAKQLHFPYYLYDGRGTIIIFLEIYEGNQREIPGRN